MGHWESAGLPDDFDGIVRLFPLPNIVLFPHVVQALHIFEPRYCEMLSEALESDHLITMALLSPGWENQIESSPKIGQTVCIGRIVSHTPTDDGKHNILLAGIKRARIVEELDVSTPFRQARVEILNEPEAVLTDYELELYRENLLKVFRSFMPLEASESKSFGELLTRQLPLNVLIDIVSYAVNLPSQIKLSILGEADIVARYEILMDHLGSPELEQLEHGPKQKDAPRKDTLNKNASSKEASQQTRDPGLTFPPPFSEN